MSCRVRSPNAPVVAIPRLPLFIIAGFIVGVSHAVFDVVVDNEIQFLVGKAVMFGKDLVDLIYYRFRLTPYIEPRSNIAARPRVNSLFH